MYIRHIRSPTTVIHTLCIARCFFLYSSLAILMRYRWMYAWCSNWVNSIRYMNLCERMCARRDPCKCTLANTQMFGIRVHRIIGIWQKRKKTNMKRVYAAGEEQEISWWLGKKNLASEFSSFSFPACRRFSVYVRQWDCVGEVCAKMWINLTVTHFINYARLCHS